MLGDVAARLASSVSPVRQALRRPTPDAPRVVVLGDLVLDVALVPSRAPERGSDVPGRVLLRQGGSAASAARWLGRLGARVTLVCAVGRDATGRALIAALESDGVRVRALRVAGRPTGRIGVIVEPGGERSFVTDRGAALALTPGSLRTEWFQRAEALHLPAYSLLDKPLGDAGLAAARLAHAAGALVTVDLASAAPLLAAGRDAALALIAEAAPDLLFATADEAEALLGTDDPHGLLELAPIAVVKRGRRGATLLARTGDLRLDVPTTPAEASDTTGAGDAFDAGFLAAWLIARRPAGDVRDALAAGAANGHRTALRHLSNPPGELDLG